MIIGRKNEVSTLERLLQDDRSHFLAVYGRRRVGKTFLIREFFGYRFTFQHSGLSDGGIRDQLYAFESSIKDAGGMSPGNPGNWLEEFEDLKELIRNSNEKKKVIFIDELSWMDTRNSDLITALENFWNGWASARKDILLIVCTSATSWMMSKIIHNKGGLYNRLTSQIHLKPFVLSECEEYVRTEGITLRRDQILQYYMVFGGIPFYWGFVERGLSVAQNIDKMFFAENAPLKDEFRYLYASVFRNPSVHLSIVEALGKKKAGMTREEIVEEAGVANSGDLTLKLEELSSCGFIRKFYAYGMKKKGAVYQLVDFFTLFYYRFMSANTYDEHFFENQVNTPAVNSWMGLAFERVCLEHIAQIKTRLGISGVSTTVNSWYCSRNPDKGIFGSQIDLLIVRKDQVINLCEMKYSGSEYMMSDKDEESIRHKVNDLIKGTGTRYAVFPTLISNYGLVENTHSADIQAVITSDDLFVR